jgi:hypothetical protein
MGRASPWRKRLWSTAWSHIRQRPLAGRGYAFSSADLFADFASARATYEARIRGVSTAGQFHNVPLNLAYFCGLPVSLLFCVAWVITLWHIVGIATRAASWFGAFMVGFLVYAVAATGQALMNGGGRDFLAICLMMGLTQAIRFGLQPEQEPVAGEDAVSEPSATT